MPTQNCSLWRNLENWFGRHGGRPREGGEFEDAALAKIAATDGRSFMVVPTVLAAEAIKRYGFLALGRTKEIESQFYAITAELRFAHQAMLALTARLSPVRKKVKRK